MRKEREVICAGCLRPYMSSGTTAKYCSRACGHYVRYKSKRYDEVRTCPVCQRTFETNRWDRVRTCGMTCGHVLGQQTLKMRREAAAT